MSRKPRTGLMILAMAWLAVLPARAAEASQSSPSSKPVVSFQRAASPPAAGRSEPALEQAKWIWAALTNSSCELRRVVTLGERPASASILITADNGYELYVNGSLVGSDVGAEADVWKSVERYDIAALLTRGRNVIGIRGTDLGGVRGVLAAVSIQTTDGKGVWLETDATWRAAQDAEPKDYSHPEYVETADWGDAVIVATNGAAPWGRLAWSPAFAGRRTKSAAQVELAPLPANFAWPERIAFLAEDCSVYVPLRGDAWGVAFRVRDWSRAYTEFDLPCPSKIGRKLMVLEPGPGAKPRVLADAGAGVIGSPSAAFDGKSLLVAMAQSGEKFFHIYRIPSTGGAPAKLTDGTFHDIDPAELPDGRIVFTSTRIGTFEEYHSPPARSLFVMNADGSNIQPITHTLIFDNEPKVMADGRVVFIRTDNFFDRGKVETHLHVIRPDGTDGLTEAGAEVGPDYGVRLRALGYGSPAPLPDGRLAFISNHGNYISAVGSAERDFQRLPEPLADLSALPDGRLLATVLRGIGRHTVSDVIAVIEPGDNKLVPIYESRGVSVHSPVFVGARAKPPRIPDYASHKATGRVQQLSNVTVQPFKDSPTKTFNGAPTGFLYCEDARITKKQKADWRNIKAIRVLGALPLTVRSSHSHIVHVGHQTVELGTVPLAPDGSFFVEVPADTPLALQAVDAEGRSELNEMSWIYVRPGEKRSCVGCHQPRQSAPPLNRRPSMALQVSAAKLLGQGDPHKFRGNNPAVTGMMDLQFERFRECASINLHPANRGERHTSSPTNDQTWREEIGSLIAELRGKDEGLRISAAQRLGLLREHATAPALIQRLYDGSREVRLAAAFALGACATRDSVPGLLDALDDRDSLVAQAAVVALINLTGGTIGEFNAFAATEKRHAQAMEWREWFAKHDWNAIERTLIPRITAPLDPPRRAIVALGHVGGTAAATALREYVRDAAARNPYPRFENDNRTDTFTYSAESKWNPRTLQEAVRALGELKDTNAVALLSTILASNREPRTANLYLAEAAVEALGRIATPAAEQALIDAFARLRNYWEYVGWYSDHPALYACHSSPVHARIIEALERIGSQHAAALVPAVIVSVPTDPDRALFPFNDDYEELAGRVIRRNDRGAEVIETCLALLGDVGAKPSPEIQRAIETTHPAWGGHPGPQNRASQILSLACRDSQYESRVRAAFERYRDMPEEPIKRELGNPTWTPVRHWTLFYLARTLGNLRDPQSVDTLMAALDPKLNEARHGRPDPATPEIHFLHLDFTPCWRAAAAWALGRIGDRRSTQVLLDAVANFDNAPDVRHTAAQALQSIADPGALPALRKLAAQYPEVLTRRVLENACATIESAHVTKVMARAANPE